MKLEIRNHWERLIRISRLSEENLEIAYNQLLLKISFLDEQIIPVEIWETSEALVKDIDIDDIAFLALTIYLDGYLWRGDKVLIIGLRNKDFKNSLTTAEIDSIRLS